jgi:hypothetical protein
MAARKPRNANLYANPKHYKRDGEDGDRTYFQLEEEAVEELQGAVAKAEFGGTGINGVKWIRKEQSKSKNQDLDWWRKYRCPYSNSHDKCPRECRVAESKERLEQNLDPFYIAFGGASHHHTQGVFKRGLPVTSKTEVFNSPTKLLNTKPARNVSRLAAMPEATCDRREQGQLKAFQKRQKKRVQSAHLPEDMNHMSFGAVCSTIDMQHLDQKAAAGANFTAHTGFLCTTPGANYICIDGSNEGESRRVVAVFSTENLLLNGFRATQQGSAVTVHADASHRYHTSDWLFYLPVSVTSMNQECHILAYALTSSDDKEATNFIYEAVKYQAKRIVDREKSMTQPLLVDV